MVKAPRYGLCPLRQESMPARYTRRSRPFPRAQCARYAAASRTRRTVTWIVTVLLVLLAAAYLAHWARGNGLDLRVYRAGIDSWRSGHNPYLGAFTIHHLHFTYP